MEPDYTGYEWDFSTSPEECRLSGQTLAMAYKTSARRPRAERVGTEFSMKATAKHAPLHERHDPSHPLLRELVFVQVDADNRVSFAVNLTRIPSIGEAIRHKEKYYRVLRVFHEPVDDDGRSFIGYHAMIDAEYWPDDTIPQVRPAAPKRRKKARRS